MSEVIHIDNVLEPLRLYLLTMESGITALESRPSVPARLIANDPLAAQVAAHTEAACSPASTTSSSASQPTSPSSPSSPPPSSASSPSSRGAGGEVPAWITPEMFPLPPGTTTVYEGLVQPRAMPVHMRWVGGHWVHSQENQAILSRSVVCGHSGKWDVPPGFDLTRYPAQIEHQEQSPVKIEQNGAEVDILPPAEGETAWDRAVSDGGVIDNRFGFNAFVAAEVARARGEVQTADTNVEWIRDRLKARAAKGLETYGVTTERTDLSRLEWINHAIDEALDHAVYLRKLATIEEARTRDPREVARDECHDRLIVDNGLYNGDYVRVCMVAAIERDRRGE